MLRIPITTEIDGKAFLKNVANLPLSELETFAKELNDLIQQRRKKQIEQQEKALLVKINQAVLSKTKHEKILQLSPKVELETITTEEQKELLKLLTEAEELRNKRLEVMIELADLKAVSLPIIMKELGLKPLKRA
ncbi:MAG: hypothetical protein AB8G86_21205 [Saprospiraceae bacterium]